MEKNPEKAATGPSLRVPRKLGEQAIAALRQLGLLDPSLAIKAMDDLIALPLRRSPEPIEMAKLRQAVSQLTLSQDVFSTRLSKPETLRETLSSETNRPLEQVPVSFDIVGDIGILEFDSGIVSEQGEVARSLMQIHSNIHAVFAKAGPITGSERTRPLHHLGGENRTTTVHREFGCLFQMDLSKAFFSPRLSSEHMRVVKQVSEGEHVLDMFAGVGPFSVLIAKARKSVIVDSIDSNPDAAEYIRKNAKLNKVENKITVWNGDASIIVPKHLAGTSNRVIMNHPSQSKNFLATACLALKQGGGIIHFYTFSQDKDSEEKAQHELRQGVEPAGFNLTRIREIRKVREVGPFTWQIAIDAEVRPAQF